MDTNKVDSYIIANQKYFPSEKITIIKEKLNSLDDSRADMIYCLNLKDPVIILLFSLFLGSFGIDRFMLGDIGLGIIKLLTSGGCGIWSIIDWFIITNKTKEYNFNLIMSIL